jgi:hypothetical protein
MKYIITESKLDKIIDKFITTQFGDLVNIDNNEYGIPNNRDIWVTSDRKVVLIFVNKDSKLKRQIFVEDSVYNTIYRMFSMDGFHEIQKHLIYWFEKHMNIKVDEVYTFDTHGSEYVY